MVPFDLALGHRMIRGAGETTLDNVRGAFRSPEAEPTAKQQRPHQQPERHCPGADAEYHHRIVGQRQRNGGAGPQPTAHERFVHELLVAEGRGRIGVAFGIDDAQTARALWR